jgi:phosphoribosyl-AMP cyclohydrolase
MSTDTDISTWVDHLRQELPGTVAVILKGSHAHGAAGEHSDIDFDVLVDGEHHEDYLVFFDARDDGRLQHVSVAVQDLDGWLAEADEPVDWAYGLPAAETTRLLWASNDELRAQLDMPARMHPPEAPELEDFVEAWGKVRNAQRRGDDLAMRLAAQKLARLCPGLLRPLNPEVFPSNRREAMRAVLDLPVAPDGYQDNLLRCLGLTGEAVSMNDLHAAARRLTFGTIALLREHADEMEALLEDDLYAYLVDGTLDRYIRQGEEDGR